MDDSKKYLLFISTLELGGAERQAINFAKYLQNKNISVSIIGCGDKGIVSSICEAEKIPCYQLDQKLIGIKLLTHFICILCRFFRKPVFEISAILNLLFFLRKNKTDVVISYCAFANTIAGLAKTYYKQKSLFVWYQRDAGIYNCPDYFQRKAVLNVDVVLANSSSGQNFIQNTYSRSCKVIYNGVRLALPENSPLWWKKQIDYKDNMKIALMIANLSRAKDHITLLKAWELVCKSKHNYSPVLLLAGKFDDKYDELKRFVKEKNLEQNIKFLGPVKDVSGLLQITDLSVFSSNSEGSPNGVIEACFAAKALVSTNLDVISQILCDGNKQFLFLPGDYESASKNIMALFDNSQLATEIGLKNKEIAFNLFDYDKNFESIVKLVN